MADETLHCREGHVWTRPEGSSSKKPELCPYHAAQKAKTPKPPSKREKERWSPHERLQHGKQVKAAERVNSEAETYVTRLREQVAHVDDDIAVATKAYEESLAKTVKATTMADINQTFKVSDRRMTTLLNLLDHKRKLEAQLAAVFSD